MSEGAIESDLSTPGILESASGENHSNEYVVGFKTDDFKIRRKIRSRKELPLDKYTSLSVVLEKTLKKKRPRDDPLPVVNLKKESIPKKHILGPLPAARPPRSANFHATGHSNARQPIGLIPVNHVPTSRSDALAATGQQVTPPTWLSPIYQTYGIGGPFGPFGPFQAPPCQHCQQDTPTVNKPPTPSFSPQPQNRKSKLGQIFGGPKKQEVENTEEDMIFSAGDESMHNFLNFIDHNLTLMRSFLRQKKTNKDKMTGIIHNLNSMLEAAKQFDMEYEERHKTVRGVRLGSTV